VRVPQHALECAGVPAGKYQGVELLSGKTAVVTMDGEQCLPVQIQPHSAVMWKLTPSAE